MFECCKVEAQSATLQFAYLKCKCKLMLQVLVDIWTEEKYIYMGGKFILLQFNQQSMQYE